MKNNFILNSIYFFIVISTIFVIISSNTVYALFFLILSFILSSILLIVLECEFIALLVIIIYVGAISVVFLFVIMMVDLKLKNFYKNFTIYLFSGSFYLLGVYFLTYENLFLNFKTCCINNIFYTSNFYVNWFNLESSVYEIESYSRILYNFFVLQFLLVGFILLVVLIVSIHFSNFNVKNVKSQNSIKQIACTITNC